MISFGKKLRERREAKGYSQSKLASEAGLHHSIIGRYERDEAKPTIDIVRNMAKALDTTVGYLLGETEDDNLLKDPKMLNRLKELTSFTEKEIEQVYFNLDAVIREIKNRKTYSA